MNNINITLPESLEIFIVQQIAEADQELENFLDELADDFAVCVGVNAPILSDYAVSRESIYEDHN